MQITESSFAFLLEFCVNFLFLTLFKVEKKQISCISLKVRYIMILCYCTTLSPTLFLSLFSFNFCDDMFFFNNHRFSNKNKLFFRCFCPQNVRNFFCHNLRDLGERQWDSLPKMEVVIVNTFKLFASLFSDLDYFKIESAILLPSATIYVSSLIIIL